MPSTFSIEQINLSGSRVTAANGVIYVDGVPVTMGGSIPINADHLFVKGYAPLSFYSRLGIHGSQLGEVFLNEGFMATGWMITCTDPGTGANLSGRFYERPANSVVGGGTISTFNLSSGAIYEKSSPMSYEVYGSKIIGIDIDACPDDISSISINLLGYYAGAGHFDRVPYTYDYYANGNQTGSNLNEKIVQYSSTFTGLNVYCNTSGTSGTIPYTGVIYSKDKNGAVTYGPAVGINSGFMYSENPISYYVSGGSRIGLTISGTMSGISDICISLLGYIN